MPAYVVFSAWSIQDATILKASYDTIFRFSSQFFLLISADTAGDVRRKILAADPTLTTAYFCVLALRYDFDGLLSPEAWQWIRQHAAAFGVECQECSRQYFTGREDAARLGEYKLQSLREENEKLKSKIKERRIVTGSRITSHAGGVDSLNFPRIALHLSAEDIHRSQADETTAVLLKQDGGELQGLTALSEASELEEIPQFGRKHHG